MILNKTMFELRINFNWAGADVDLIYTSDHTSFLMLLDSQTRYVFGSKGSLMSGNNNNLSLSWEDNVVEFSAELHEDGFGDFTQTVILNQQQLDSLHYCLRKWQALQQHLKDGKQSTDFDFE